MLATITAFESSPDRGRGLSRDVQVRWALEEVGQRYEVRPVSFAAMKAPAHRALQPFGQIPTYEKDGLVLFESGAIVLHIAQHYPGLLPVEPDARARAVAWMFAASDTVKMPVVQREAALLTERDKSWFAARLEILDARLRVRLGELAERLGDAEWLDGGFSAGDLMMVGLLRRPSCLAVLEDYRGLLDYVRRGEERPAFQRALAAQRAEFEASRKI
jgi:glutathione S-transferase